MKIKTQLTLAALMAMGLFASGCSQQSADASVSPAQQTTQATSQQTTQATSQQTTSQQTSQQATAVEEGEKVVVEEEMGAKPVIREVVRTVVDCSKCGGAKRPGGRPAGGKWTHSHPAIPGCTNSITHSHPYTNRNHTHHYSCKKAGPKKVVKRPMGSKRPMGGKRPSRPMGNKWLHSHPAIPGCTNSVTHAHPYTNRNHTHAYGCRNQARRPAVRPQPPRRPVPPMMRPVPRPLPPVQVPTIVVPPTKAKGNYKGPIGYNPATLKMMSDYQQAQ